MVGGINSTDFTAFALEDWKVTIVRTPVTKTTDFRGSEVLTSGSTNNVDSVFVRKKDEWVRVFEGLKRDADGYIMVAPDEAFNKDDTFTYDGETFRVEKFIVRGPPGSTALYKFCNVYLI